MTLLRIVITAIAIAWCPLSLLAAPQADVRLPVTRGPILFRQHLMTEELIAEQGEGYLPIQRSKFEAAVQDSSRKAVPGATAWLLQSTYRVRLRGDETLAGVAEFEVSRANGSPGVVSLTPCGLAINTPVWLDGSRAELRTGVNSAGDFIAVIDRDSPFEFEWRLRGERSKTGELQYSLRLPVAPMRRMLLELPRDLVPRSTQAAIKVVPQQSDESDVRLWQLDFGSQPDLALKIVKEDSGPSTTPSLVFARESFSYRLTSSGLELLASLRLDINGPPIRELFLHATSPLQIATAKLRDKPLIVEPMGAVGQSTSSSYRVTFAEPEQGSGLDLTVTAVAPVMTGQAWTLPTVAVRDAIWQGGTTTLEIEEPLSLASLQPRGCIGRKVEPLPLPLRGELRQFQSFTPDRGLEIRLASNTQELVAESGLTLRFTESILSGHLIVDLQALRGEPFEIRGMVQQGWVIDNVQAEPADRLDSYKIEGPGQQGVVFRFRQSINATSKTRLIVRGHRRNPISNRPSNVGNMRFLRLPDVVQQSGLIALVVESPLRLAVTGDQLSSPVPVESLSPVESSRLATTASARIFRDDASLGMMSVAISPEQPRYSAQIAVETRVESQTLAQSYEFHVTPERSHVSRLLVRFSEASLVPPTWSIINSQDNVISARLLQSAERAMGDELWEVVAVRPLTAPFTIRAERKEKFTSNRAIPLPSIPEASAQSGSVRVVSVDGVPLDITTRNMKRVAAERTTTHEIPAVRGIYRYVPSQDAAIQLSRPVTRPGQSPAWIWLSQLNSRMASGGEDRHELNLYIENQGLTSIEIGMPNFESLVAVEIDNAEAEYNYREMVGALTIPLPKGNRFPTITIVFVTKSAPFSVAKWIQPPWPQTNLTTFQKRWNAWVPSDLRLANGIGDSQFVAWDERLFGLPLVRRTGRTFNPFSVADWKTLSRSESEEASDAPESTEPQVAAEAWVGGSRYVGPDELAAGWTRSTRNVSANTKVEALLYSKSTVKTGGSGMLLIVFATLVWLSPRRGLSIAIILLASIVLVLLVPAEFLPLARGIFLGALLASVSIWLPRSLPYVSHVPARPSSSSYRTQSLSTTTLPLIIAAILLMLPGESAAQAPANAQPPAKPAKPTIHAVLVPVDDQQKPTGDYVYVPKSLFDELHRRAAEGETGSLGPLISRAHYRVELSSPSDGIEPLQLRTLIAEYELSDLPANAQLRLPFRRDRVHVSEVRLDDQAIDYEWSENGEELIVHLELSQGRILQMNLRPLRANPAQELSIGIPRVPASQVIVRSSAGVDMCEIPSALGGIERNNPGELTAYLGNASELRVTWQSKPITDSEGIDADVAELIWMNIQPNSVVVNAQFKLAIVQTGLPYIDIEADPRLRLLPNSDRPFRVEELHENGTRVIRCHLMDLFEKDMTIELAFGMNGGLGNLTLPRLSAKAKRHAPVWLGVTTAQGLAAEVLPAERATAIPPATFVKTWNKEVDPPQIAVSLPDMTTVWQLSVRPLSQQLTGDQQVEVVLGRGQAAINYESLFTLEHGSNLQQRFRVPEGFQPTEILVVHDDVNRLLRWSRVDPRMISVFFTAPVSGTYRVWLRGELPLPRSGKFTIPLITSEDINHKSLPVNVVQIAHETDLLVKIEGTPGLVVEEPAAPAQVSRGRWLASLRGDPTASVEQSLQLNLTPNRPRLVGSAATRMDYDDGSWWAETSIELNVRAGVAELIRLRIPATIVGDLEIEPKIQPEFVPLPGESDRQVLLRLLSPESRTVSLRIRGKMDVPENEAVRAPDVQLLDTAELQRYVVLPRLVDGRPVAWATSGLQAAELPTTHRLPEGISPIVDVYQVVGPYMQAQLEPLERVGGSPQVRFAEFRLRWFDEGTCQGWAAFDVEPAGATELLLHVPEGQRLIHVSSNGVPSSVTPVEKNDFRVAIALQHLPQRVEVLFEGDLKLSGGNPQLIAFAAPHLIDVSYGESAWTVTGPSSAGSGSPLLAHSAAVERTIAGKRLTSARALLKSVSTTRDTSDDLAAWRQGWQHWVDQLEQELAAFNQIEEATRTRVLASVFPSGPRYDFGDTWSFPSGEKAEPLYGVFQGLAPRFVVQYTKPTWREWLTRVLVAAAVIGLALLLWAASKHRWFRETLVRYPHLVIGMLGVAWYISLVPSLVGLMIMLFAGLLAVRPAWKTKPV